MRTAATLAALLALAATPATSLRAQTHFTVTSPDVKPGAMIPTSHVFNGMGCAGQNVSPALRWSGAPAGTKSYAVTVYDPDAPTGSGWWHWVLYDIPANVTSLAAGAKGVGVEGTTDMGTKGYGGPCPPKGDKPHRYVFTVYALKTDKLDVPANATAAMVGFNLHANQLAKVTLTAKYGR
jgi:Raf kinase inhibitor-like YbhB/YbcL family protein